METIQASFDHIRRENRLGEPRPSEGLGEARKDALRLDFNRKLKL